MIRKQKYIMREDLRNNPDWMYLFGDNVQRTGLGGQAKEMRGEPNAVGVATKIFPSGEPVAYFTDDDYFNNVSIMLEDLSPAIGHLQEGGTLIIPSDGLGTGLSDLANRAPRTNRALQDLIGYLYNIDERNNKTGDDL